MANKKITIRDANVNARNANFSGKAKNPQDRDGSRYFLVRLDEDQAEELLADGWPVKRTKDHPEIDNYTPYPYLKVLINYDSYNRGYKPEPAVYMVTKKSRTLLHEDTVKELDGCYFEKVDITIENAYIKRYDCWTAYLVIGFFTIQPEELYDEYFPNVAGSEIDDEDDIPFM